MRFYRYAGLRVCCAFPLEDLPTARIGQDDEAVFNFRMLGSPPHEPPNSDWVHRWETQSGCQSLALATTGDGFLLRFPDLADFTISRSGLQLAAWPLASTDPETIHHLLLDQVLPRVLALQGKVVLHAGAVRIGDRAIAFTGESCCGKSTLAASFVAAGHSLLSDDGLVLDPGEDCTLVTPTYPSLRLWPETVAGIFPETPRLAPMAHYTRKRRVILDPIANTNGQPLPLAALYLLAPASATEPQRISVTRLSPPNACMAIIANTFQLDATDQHRAADLLSKAGQIAQHLSVFKLIYSRDFACLSDVRLAILRQHEGRANPLGIG